MKTVYKILNEILSKLNKDLKYQLFFYYLDIDKENELIDQNKYLVKEILNIYDNKKYILPYKENIYFNGNYIKWNHIHKERQFIYSCKE